MTRLTYILAILFLISSCSRNQTSNSEKEILEPDEDYVSEQIELSDQDFFEDTILERCDPKSLDLSKYQIFIDTTKNSEFYKNLKNWSASKWDIQSINVTLNAINKDLNFSKIELIDFPSQFITLRKLNGQFFLYDRCDGIDPRFEIRDTAFISYGPLESDAESISKLIFLTEKSIELELRSFQAKSNYSYSKLKIDKIQEFIYRLTYTNKTYHRIEYVTTIDGIEKFDLVVNHCPDRKSIEFEGFDKE